MAARLRPLYSGAEADLYLVEILGGKFILKHRVSKPYRHPVFDKIFRIIRTRTEAKILVKLYLNNIPVPAPLFVDTDRSIIILQLIEGKRLSDMLDSMRKKDMRDLSYRIGSATARMHRLHIYHGDLTLSNIIVKGNKEFYLIDFGLSGTSTDIEEYAIDAHLLDRSLNALFPEYREFFMIGFWRGYESIDIKQYLNVYNRFKEIKTRGRYIESRRKKNHYDGNRK